MGLFIVNLYCFMYLIYDIFNFNNELDILEIRLNILDNYVDYFIIIEARETYSGVEKVLSYELHKNRFKKFNHKIIYHIIDKLPYGLNDLNCDKNMLKFAIECNFHNFTNPYGFREFYQKEWIRESILNLDDNDICYISDVDEIWNPDMNIIIGDDVYKPMMNWHYLEYLNVRSTADWMTMTGTIITRYKNIKYNSIKRLQTEWIMRCKYVYVNDGGWHFNAIGGIDKKIDDWKHPIYNETYLKQNAYGTYVSEKELPKYVIDNKYKYSHLFRSNYL